MIDNAADPASIDRKRNKRDAIESTRRIIVRTLMSTTQGRAYLWDELSQLNVFAQTLQFGRDGYAATAFAEGRRSHGLRLLSTITQHCPNEYMQMTRENSGVDLEPDNANPEDAD